jgi:hypothetical protein
LHCLTGKASNPSICIATTAYAKKELAGHWKSVPITIVDVWIY